MIVIYNFNENIKNPNSKNYNITILYKKNIYICIHVIIKLYITTQVLEIINNLVFVLELLKISSSWCLGLENYTSETQ